MERLVSVVKGPSDWAPLAEFVSVEKFEREGQPLWLYRDQQVARVELFELDQLDAVLARFAGLARSG